VQAVIGKHLKDLDDRLGFIVKSELAKELLPHLVHRIEEASIAPETMSKLKTAAGMSAKLGDFLIRNSFTPKAGLGGLFKLDQYSGTTAHGAVKAIGQFFGKSFKPWEAVKWTRAAANLGRGLAVVGTALTFILQIKEDADAAQIEKELRESRAVGRSGFNDAAHAIELHYDQATGAYITSTLETEIETLDQQLAELRDMQKSRSDLFQSLIGLLQETRDMIRDLHTGTQEII
jgi:hypothetical protein